MYSPSAYMPGLLLVVGVLSSFVDSSGDWRMAWRRRASVWGSRYGSRIFALTLLVATLLVNIMVWALDGPFAGEFTLLDCCLTALMVGLAYEFWFPHYNFITRGIERESLIETVAVALRGRGEVVLAGEEALELPRRGARVTFTASDEGIVVATVPRQHGQLVANLIPAVKVAINRVPASVPRRGGHEVVAPGSWYVDLLCPLRVGSLRLGAG